KFHAAPERRKAVADELSDVLMGVIRVADLLDIDLAEAFASKMVENRRKYPPEKVQGRAVKYTEL
ncbi:MAG: nucleotide pyrophosphohydrolase, partial [Betaproteobacteria bacterium]|nr:nucleotide pyrophosphohydrolase [Candidatus Proximibacter danicus]